VPDLQKREDVLGQALSPYAVSKRAMELYAGVFARRYGLETVVLRYFNVFGPRQNPDSAYAAVVPLFFKAGYTGARPVIHGDGEQSRDFTYVGDVVKANLLAGETPLPDGAHLVANVAQGGNVTVNRLWQAIAALTGSTAEPDHRPPRPGDVRQSSAAIARLRAWLSWVPATPLEEGLEKARPFYRERVSGRLQTA
jgi:nucleoside-diphosphate-sugar epimerase